MELSDLVALLLFILGLTYISYWYLKRHFIGTRDGEEICPRCGSELSLEKETILKKITKRFYLRISPFPRKHRVKEIWVCNSCGCKTERTVSFG